MMFMNNPDIDSIGVGGRGWNQNLGDLEAEARISCEV